MNLTDMFAKDSSIVAQSLADLSWLKDSGLSRIDDPILNIDSMRNPNNIKPQLEMEWGIGKGDINLDEPAGCVERNIPKDQLGDAKSVIMFARDQMNRGVRGSKVVQSLKNKYPKELLFMAKEGLHEMFGMEGLVGRIMIDARGYKNCKVALDLVANSPYKSFIKYVYGCDCGEPHIVASNETDVIGKIQDSTGNGMDDFMSDKSYTSKMKELCCSTMLERIGRGDLDDSMMDETLIDMNNLASLPEHVSSKIRKNNISNLSKIKLAFSWLDKQADLKNGVKYMASVDNIEFVLKVKDDEVDILNAPPATKIFDVTNKSLLTDIEYQKPSQSNKLDGMDNFTGGLDEVPIVGDFSETPISVELLDESGGVSRVQVNQSPQIVKKQVIDTIPINFDMQFSDLADVSDINLDRDQEVVLDDKPEVFGSLDVDPNTGEMPVDSFQIDNVDIDFTEHLDSEFQGVDEFELDNIAKTKEDLPVSMKIDEGEIFF